LDSFSLFKSFDIIKADLHCYILARLYLKHQHFQKAAGVINKGFITTSGTIKGSKIKKEVCPYLK